MKRQFLLIVLSCLSLSAAEVSIEEWDLPTARAFPHDPAVAPEGALWYTGMRANHLGRIDISTGEIREYPLPTPGSAPHGLAADREGNIWFTANARGYIGRLDPRSGTVKEFPLPDPKADDPHTLVFDDKGTIWFTVQRGDFLRRLDPATGSIDLRRSPTPGSRPYGIVVNSKGFPFSANWGPTKSGVLTPPPWT